MRRLLTRRRSGRVELYNTPEEREGLRTACRFNAQLMDFLRPQVREGVTTARIDELAETYTRDHGHIPACLGYQGFPKSICTSVNEVICHGIPNNRVLKAGDIVNVDCTTIVHQWFGDCSETFMIGEVAPPTRKLVQAAFDAMWVGIRAIYPYCSVVEIGSAIARYGWEKGYGVVEKFQGHSIGREFHQQPGIPHVPMDISRRYIIAPGMCFTVEPMINMGTKEHEGPMPDGWTVVTRDRLPSAQFEHQILMTEEGPEVLTLTKNGPQAGHVF